MEIHFKHSNRTYKVMTAPQFKRDYQLFGILLNVLFYYYINYSINYLKVLVFKGIHYITVYKEQ